MRKLSISYRPGSQMLEVSQKTTEKTATVNLGRHPIPYFGAKTNTIN